MSSWCRIVLVCCLMFIGSFSHANLPGVSYQTGGEVPWPLSKQQIITVQNSQGVWQLESGQRFRLFNVEILSQQTGEDWIRVAELDDMNQVVAWGDGFFANGKKSLGGIWTSTGVKDGLGRYLYMYPNGDLEKRPFQVRLVEVKTPAGHVLGVSVIDTILNKAEHMLGQRLASQPLKCSKRPDSIEHLQCQEK